MNSAGGATRSGTNSSIPERFGAASEAIVKAVLPSNRHSR